jgi:hypothetical protein
MQGGSLKHYTIYLRAAQYDYKKDENKAVIQSEQNKLDQQAKDTFLNEIAKLVKKKELTILKDEPFQLKDWRPSVRLEVADTLQPTFVETMRDLEVVAMIDADHTEPTQEKTSA